MRVHRWMMRIDDGVDDWTVVIWESVVNGKKLVNATWPAQ